MEKGNIRPWIRDGVDVYVSPNSILHFVFLASRKRIQLRAHASLISSLEWFDGESTAEELTERFKETYGSSRLGGPSFSDFLHYLTNQGIAVPRDWMSTALPAALASRYARQLNFFLDLERSPEAAVLLFHKIRSARVVVFGLGAIGSWIFREMIQLGFREFVLVDPSQFSSSDVTRHALYTQANVGKLKINVARDFARSFDQDSMVITVDRYFDVDSQTSDFLNGPCDLIINTADEPYIGATSLKLSRFCVQHGVPLLVAGGFDAHLGSLSEMIVPGTTPCADCYSRFFERELRDWKPFPHPVEDRRGGFGGLSSLSVFAASAGVMKILRLFSKECGDVDAGRGEMNFSDYHIDSFRVERDPECPACKHLGSPTSS